MPPASRSRSRSRSKSQSRSRSQSAASRSRSRSRSRSPVNKRDVEARSRSASPRSSREEREESRRDALATDTSKSAANELPPGAVDREKTCPFLLRVFCREGAHNRPDDYRGLRVPPEELQMYTWMDANLKELSTLIKEVNKHARRRGSRMEFAVVYRDNRGNPMVRPIGMVSNGENAGPDDDKCLKDIRFRIGDYVDVAILSSRRPERRGRGFGDRDDRFGDRGDRFGDRGDRFGDRPSRGPDRGGFDRGRLGRRMSPPRRDLDRPRRRDYD